MADSKITGLTELAATPASNDWYVVTDVSDTTMDASGTNKKLAATRVVHKDTSGNVAVLGNFSVGTATAGAIAHIYSPSDESLRIAGTAATSNPYISFYQGTTRRSYVQHVDTNDTLNLVSEYGNVSIKAAATLGTDSEAEYVTVKAGGNVGIGQTNPAQKLDVNGIIKTTSLIFGSGSTLSEYLEGTFTPGISFGGNSTGMTFSSRVGRYIKIGKMVYVSVDIRLSAKGSSTGSAKIIGLPITSVSTAAGGVVSLIWYQMNANYVYISGAIDTSSTTISLVGLTGAGASYSSLTETAFANNSIIQATIMYEAAS